MNFKNYFKKDSRSEIQKSQDEFAAKIKTKKNGEIGFEDEFINMRMMMYISEGMEGVKNFDVRLNKSFGDYQDYLMGNSEVTFKTIDQ